jgi:hypothetical protein
MAGSADTFYYVPADKKTPPCNSPSMAQTAGGALGARTRYAAFTWSDASDNETTISAAVAMNVSANYLLRVTIPIFPRNVTKAWVYVGTSSSALHKQATAITTGSGTWTEPVGGYDAGGAAPPTTNGFTETVTARFENDTLRISKLNAVIYAMDCILEEAD